MKNRFSINLLPRRPTPKVDHRERWINSRLYFPHFGLITASCCAALTRKKEEKSIISFSSHRLTGSQREAGEMKLFRGQDRTLMRQFLIRKLFLGSLLPSFVSSPSPFLAARASSANVLLAAVRRPRSKFFWLLCVRCEALKVLLLRLTRTLLFVGSFAAKPSQTSSQLLLKPPELIISCPKVTFLSESDVPFVQSGRKHINTVHCANKFAMMMANVTSRLSGHCSIKYSWWNYSRCSWRPHKSENRGLSPDGS